MTSDSISPSVIDVASIVTRGTEPRFVERLKSAYPLFERDGFEASLAAYLRLETSLIDRWSTWSGDQRWTPSVYLEGTEVGFYDGTCRNVRQHEDPASAAADFIHRLVAWVAVRQVIGGRNSGR